MTEPEVAVVVVTYNSAEWISRCLDALPAALGDRRAHVVVVDNPATDDTADVVAARHPDVTLLRNARNVGFAAAVNVGAAASSAPWVLLLNPDTVPRPGSLARLLEFAENHPGHGLYGGRTLAEDGTLEPTSAWGAPSVWSTVCFATGLSSFFPRSRVFDPESLGRWQRDTVREVGIVTGCLLLADRGTWDRLRGMDERYFVYGEDADLSARARRIGLRPVITPDAEVVHAVGASSEEAGGNFALVFAGKVTYARTHFRGVAAGVVVWLLRAGVAWRATLERVTHRGGNWSAGWACRDEWWDGFPPRESAQPVAVGGARDVRARDIEGETDGRS